MYLEHALDLNTCIILTCLLIFLFVEESRLAATIMTSSRKTRGADYHGHSYDDHDDHHSVGFPSIEGALMAISFLTFAVYLVRLVMVRNIL